MFLFYFAFSIELLYIWGSHHWVKIHLDFLPFQEFLKATVDLLDLAGIYLVLSGIPGKGHAKIVTAGVGWGGAELLLTRGLLLWVGARGAEFHWKYIQKCLESNINLVSRRLKKASN